MLETGMNYWAILIAGAAAWILGALWYTPLLFGNTWMAGIGKTKEQVEKDYSPVNLVWALLGYLIAAYGLGRILSWVAADSLADGLMIGVLAAVCLVAAPAAVDDVMEGRPRSLYFVNAGYKLVTFAVMGVILGLWR